MSGSVAGWMEAEGFNECRREQTTTYTPRGLFPMTLGAMGKHDPANKSTVLRQFRRGRSTCAPS